jgi:hypothetical protein
MLGRSVAAGAAIAISGMLLLRGENPAKTAVFTAAQAEAGRTAYLSSCVNCHGETLIPRAGSAYMGQEIPPLAGSTFLAKWGPRMTDEFARRIKVATGGFPPTGMNEKTHVELAAYILKVNGARAGTQELTASTAVVIGKATATSESH